VATGVGYVDGCHFSSYQITKYLIDIMSILASTYLQRWTLVNWLAVRRLASCLMPFAFRAAWRCSATVRGLSRLSNLVTLAGSGSEPEPLHPHCCQGSLQRGQTAYRPLRCAGGASVVKRLALTDNQTAITCLHTRLPSIFGDPSRLSWQSQPQCP
jgi:hypothetical protein